MRNYKSFVLILAVFLSGSVLAQEFTGIATYKSHRKLDIKLDSTQVSSDMHKQMMEMMKKQFEKTYNLSFSREESLYKEEEQLESPQPSGMQVVIMNVSGSDILYKNLKENRYTNQNEIMGKIFLIKDELEKPKWEFTDETKFIGDYKCYKATYTREQEVVESGISVDGDKDLDADADAEPVMEEIVVTAWYTPDIPVNNGPSQYHGLPGLILEVNDGKLSLLCSKIVLNPDKKISLDEPKKGKVVNRERFDEIMDKKMKEMRERYNSERRDGTNVEIRIGG